jgi:hypothetical protein
VTDGGSVNTYGVYLNGLTTGATLQNNAIVYRNSGSMGSNTSYGLYAQSSSGLAVDHNRIDEPGMITAGSFTAAGFSGVTASWFKFNDVNSTGTGLTNAYLLNLAASSVTVRDNIFLSSFSVSGSSASFYADAASGLNSNFNDWFSSNAANTLIWGGVPYAFPWGSSTGFDQNSISANPLWANPTVGNEDFHPLSTVNHGRYDPASGLFDLPADGASSPTIDKADPVETSWTNEPTPNGSRCNLGSYGGTAQASESPASTTAQGTLFPFD